MFIPARFFRVIFLLCVFAVFSGCSHIRVEGQSTYYDRVEALELMATVGPQAGKPDATKEESEKNKSTLAEY